MNEELCSHFEMQAIACDGLGSPFTGGLIRAMLADVKAGGPIADLVGSWPGSPQADAVSLRLAGALHSAALTKRDPMLAAVYPGGADFSGSEKAWPVARAFLEREHAFAANFIKSPPQTNETRRSAGLLLGFAAASREFGLPLATLEIGASAGLNLSWDSFAYRTSSWACGEGTVAIETDWQGPALKIAAMPKVVSRAGCDISPPDIRNPQARLQLRSYVWADQAERLARFDAAVTIALERDVRIERESAETWLKRRLADRREEVCTVVYHSIFYQYPPREVRAAIAEVIERAGVAATADAPIVWLRFEPEALLGGPKDSLRIIVDMVTWPGAERRVLAEVDPHGRWLRVL